MRCGAAENRAADRVVLGDSGLEVSECCLGTMTWGKQNTEAEAHQQLSYALDRGVNFLDAAEMYPVPTEAETQGRTEEYIGSWLKGQPRDKVVVASKVCGASEQITWVRDSGSGTRVDRAQIREAVEKSLTRLQTDYIDLLQIHWPDRYVPLFGGAAYDAALERDAVPFEEQLEAMQELVAEGKVRAIGVSNETSYGVMQFCQAAADRNLPKIASIQNSYSLLVRTPIETNLSEVLSPRNLNVGLLAYSPLAGGALTGKYLHATPEGSRFTLFPGYMERFQKSDTMSAVAEYVEVANKYGLTPSQLAIAFCQSRWFVTSSIIGATSMDQLRENMDAFDVELSEECLADIDRVYKRWRDPTTS